jgi:hypothetical protein
MKTHKILQKHLFLLLTFLLLFSSCEQEEKPPTTTVSILGEWILDKIEITTLDSGSTDTITEELSGFGVRLNFNNDDTYLKIDPDEALFLYEDNEGFGTWEFTNNFSQIIFSRGVYSFYGGKERIWNIIELTNESLIASITFENKIQKQQQTFLYTFNRTSQSGEDISPKDVISKKWQLDKVDFKRYHLRPNGEVGQLVEDATGVKGFGADINFLADNAYAFDPNKNVDYATIFGQSSGIWEFDFPYTSLNIQLNNRENWKEFEVKELNDDRLILYFQNNRIGETLLGQEQDYYEEFVFTFTPFNEAQDEAQKPLSDIFLQKWFIEEMEVLLVIDGEFFEDGETKGYGESIEFSSDNRGDVYVFDQAGNPNFSETFEQEGAWQLPFPYTKLWINPEFSFVDEIILNISELTDNQFVVSALDTDVDEGVTIEQEFKVRFVTTGNFELLRSPKDSLKGEWELVLLDIVQTKNGNIINQDTQSNFDQIKLTFNNQNLDEGEISFFSAPRNPELLGFFPSEATWQFSMLYQYLIVNGRPYKIDIFEQNRIGLTLEVLDDDGVNTAYSFVFLRFGTRNQIPANADELLVGEWELESLLSESFDETGLIASQIFESDGLEFILDFKANKTYTFDMDEPYLLSVFDDSGTWEIVADPDNENVFFLFIDNASNQNPIGFFMFNLTETRLELFIEYDDSDANGNQFKTRNLYIFNKP